MIIVEDVSKTYRIAHRPSGWRAALTSLIHRSYAHIQALDHVSFSVNRGEILGYVGPNGAGKSTTIKIMTGILVPDGGCCRVMGYIPWKHRVDYVQHIGVVFGQRSQLWWDVPVIDSYELLSDIYRMSSTASRRTLEQLTQMLDLSSLLHIPVRQLSLGQRMRCELAASLLHNPSVLFLDEPTIGLDAVSKLRVRQFIKTINEETGVTVILTTHDMNDIEALAHRIMLLGRGQLLYDGSIADLKRSYKTIQTITVQFENGPASFETIPHTTIAQSSSGRAQLSVDTTRISVSDVINQLSGSLKLTDVYVESPSIESIMVQLYEEHDI